MQIAESPFSQAKDICIHINLVVGNDFSYPVELVRKQMVIHAKMRNMLLQCMLLLISLVHYIYPVLVSLDFEIHPDVVRMHRAAVAAPIKCNARQTS